MKRLKRTAALLLVFLLVLSLCGCRGSFEAKVLKGVRKMQELQSLHMDVNSDIDMSMKILRKNIGMDMDFDAASDVLIDPFEMYTELNINMMGFNKRFYNYVEKNGGSYCLYNSYNGKNWDQQELEGSEGEKDMDFLGMLSMLAKYASSFQEAGEESILIYDTLRFDGLITNADVKELIELLGGAEMLENTFGGIEGMDKALESLDEPFSVPTSVWIEKNSGVIIKYEMDISQMASKLLDLLMDDLVKNMDYKIPLTGVELELQKAVIDVTFSKFDQLTEINRPDAA